MIPGYGRAVFDGIVYVPFHADEVFKRFHDEARPWSAVPQECFWVIYCMARQCLKIPGDFWECGVDRGGSAKFIANVIAGSGKRLHLFDTFSGMPDGNPEVDYHGLGDFPPAPLQEVKARVGHEADVVVHQGLIPETFTGLEDAQIAFAHVDVDLYESTKRCCEFIYPRLSRGGVIVFDDYLRPTCAGARMAIDEYFADKDSVPLTNVVASQAVVFKI